jgi:hypothetical protein
VRGEGEEGDRLVPPRFFFHGAPPFSMDFSPLLPSLAISVSAGLLCPFVSASRKRGEREICVVFYLEREREWRTIRRESEVSKARVDI